MLWQIFVLMDTNNKIQIIVSENCLITELLKKCKEHPHIPKGASYRFYTSDGLSFQDDQDNGKKRLSDFQLTNKSTINLSVGLAGGVWPTEEEIWARQRNPKPSQRFKITDSIDHPDILDLDFDNPRVIMPCGHAIAPSSLANHCLHELKDNKPEICCPGEKCSSTWPFSLVREAADLSDEETAEFEQRILMNRQTAEVKHCPNCFVSCHRDRAKDKRVRCFNCRSKGESDYWFCWDCLRSWKGNGEDICGNSYCGDKSKLFRILAECDTKELFQTQCPSLRACPKCLLMIQHTKGCKHMTCQRCHFEFCFICLKTHNWKNIAVCYKPCKVAPRQTSDSWCVII